jgi:citrate synthase
MLESEEAARRLGIKLPTLYAYVSRGMLQSHPSANSRRRLFDLDDVERLARRSRSGRRVESRIASITTGVTQIRDDGPAYRGTPAISIVGHGNFESAADLLCEAEPAPAEWRSAGLSAPSGISRRDLLSWTTLMCGAGDPLRSDLRHDAVVRNARKVIATSVECLADAAGSKTDSGGSIAERLTRSFVAHPSPELVRAVDTALVLLADHELATSTMAVRVAASTRADIYDALLAGLAVLAGPLHGGASELAFDLLVQAERIGVGPALDATLRWQRTLPGFGHVIYGSGDPRFGVMLESVLALASPDQRELVTSLVEMAKAQAIPAPNTDLSLAALAWAAGLQPDTGRTIFSVARLAGWTAHYLEELGERPLRFRVRAVYSQAGSPG